MFFKKNKKQLAYVAPELMARIDAANRAEADKILKPAKESGNIQILMSGGGYPREFGFVLIELNDTNSEFNNELVSSINDIAVSHAISIGGIVPSLLVFYDGLINDEIDASKRRSNFVSAVLAKCSSGVRILYGKTQGYVRSVGGITPVGMISNAQALVDALKTLPFGSAKEFD